MKKLTALLLFIAVFATLLSGCAQKVTILEPTLESPVSVAGAQVNDEGHLVLQMSDGSVLDAGDVRGSNGVSVKEAFVDDNGSLKVRLSDDTMLDAGYVQGINGVDGQDGANGANGANGRDGTDGKDGLNGIDGDDGSDGSNGRDGVNGSNGADGNDGAGGADGKDGDTPLIGENGNWWIGGEDTGIKAGSGVEFIFDKKGEGTVLLSYVGNEQHVVIPEKTTAIAQEAFAGSKAMISVDIPDGVTEIGDRAFNDCDSLEAVVLPDQLEQIGEYVFANSASLREASLPILPYGWRNGMFSGCSQLEIVNFVEGYEYRQSPPGDGDRGWRINISDHMFYECTSLRTIEIPDCICTISDFAFSKSGIKELDLNHTISSCWIAWNAFEDSAIETITMDYVDSISSYAFNNCYNLKEVHIGDSCMYIGKYAFSNCTSLQSATLPTNEKYTELYAGIFYNCKALESITIPASIKRVTLDKSYYTPFSGSGIREITFLGEIPVADAVGYNYNILASYDSRIYVPSEFLSVYKMHWRNYADRIVANSLSTSLDISDKTYKTMSAYAYDLNGGAVSIGSILERNHVVLSYDYANLINTSTSNVPDAKRVAYITIEEFDRQLVAAEGIYIIVNGKKMKLSADDTAYINGKSAVRFPVSLPSVAGTEVITIVFDGFAPINGGTGRYMKVTETAVIQVTYQPA